MYINSRSTAAFHPWRFERVIGIKCGSAFHSSASAGWLPEFLSAVGDATIVTLQPGVHDYEYLCQSVDEEQVVRGMITLASYPGPLGDEEAPQAMTWWFPPLSAAPFTGPDAHVKPVVSALLKGGFPARVVRDVQTELRFGSALFMPLIAALEKNNWCLKTLVNSGDLALAGQAGREACALVLPGRRRWRLAMITQSWVLRLIVFIAPKIAPFPLEDMLKVHFTKVGAQTRAMLQAYIELSEDGMGPSDALQKLLRALSTP